MVGIDVFFNAFKYLKNLNRESIQIYTLHIIVASVHNSKSTEKRVNSRQCDNPYCIHKFTYVSKTFIEDSPNILTQG